MGSDELMELPAHVRAQANRGGYSRQGHAAQPGTGPREHTCGDCAHVTRATTGAQTFHKCLLMRAEWTGGRGSDVRARDPACRRWSAQG